MLSSVLAAPTSPSSSSLRASTQLTLQAQDSAHSKALVGASCGDMNGRTCGLCVGHSGTHAIFFSHNCAWDLATAECHRRKSGRAAPRWAARNEDCLTGVKATFDSWRPAFLDFAVQDLGSFGGNANPTWRARLDNNLATLSEENLRKATTATTSLAVKFRGGNVEGVVKSGQDAIGARAGVCTTFAAIVLAKVCEARLGGNEVTRVEIVDNGVTSQSATHLYTIINRAGGAVAPKAAIPAPGTWNGGFVADAWNAALGYPIVFDQPLRSRAQADYQGGSSSRLVLGVGTGYDDFPDDCKRA